MVKASTGINEIFPDLTAILVIGGTRTAYALHTGKPNIEDFPVFVDWNLREYQRIIRDYQALGGRHLIMPALSWQSFSKRGEKYTQGVISAMRVLITEEMRNFYKELNFRVRFTGIDTLLYLPEDTPEHQLGAELERFNQSWQTGENYLVWEVAPIPTFSILQSGIPPEGESLEGLHNGLYRQLANCTYGLDMPIPHLYIGSARNGDLKLRAMLPFALAFGTETRFYFLPYPSIMMNRAALKTILHDLAAGIQDRATGQFDYEDVLNEEAIQQKRIEFESRMADTSQILGLARR
jgi:hypothetical protein